MKFARGFVMRIATLLCVGLMLVLVAAVPAGSNLEPQENPQSTAIIAADYHEYYYRSIGPGSSFYVYIYASSDRGYYGDFTTTNYDITFYMLTSSNFDLWENGDSFYSIDSAYDVYSYAYEERVTTSGYYYFVFSNRDALYTTAYLTYDFYRDDTAPTIDINLDSGYTYSGVKTITATIDEEYFSIESVELEIDGYLVDTEYDSYLSYSWDTTDYDNDDHVITITASDNVGNSDSESITVYTSNLLPNPTGSIPGSALGTFMGIPILLLIFMGVVVAIIGAVVMTKKKEGYGPHYVPVSAGQQYAPVESQPYTPEKTEITEKVPFACQFCGFKREQGSQFCPNCGGKY